MTNAIVVPSIEADRLLRRCIAECRRLEPEADIVVLLDQAPDPPLPDGIDVVVTGPISIAAKRNRGVARTDADLVAFIDSDAYPETGWLDGASAAFTDARIAAVGGPNVSPPQQPRSQRWVGLANDSPLVSGWWAFRRDRNARARDVDALPSCNLIVRRDVYLSTGGMNEDLFTAEDTDFCRRLIAANHRIRFSPDVVVFHKNRGFRAFVVQRYTFGVAMVPLLRRGASPNWRYNLVSLAVALFAAMLLAGPLGWRWRLWRRIWTFLAGGYAAVIGTEAVRRSDHAGDVPGVIGALVVGNLAPGVGMVLEAAGVSPDLRGVYRNDRT